MKIGRYLQNNKNGNSYSLKIKWKYKLRFLTWTLARNVLRRSIINNLSCYHAARKP